MATMASLLVEVGADIGKFVGGMTKMGDQAQKTARAIKKDFTSLGADLAGILSVGMVTKFVADTIAMQDSLGKMAQKTGITVEALSELRVAAELSDTSLEAVSKGVKQLSKTMVEGEDSTSKAAKLMKALGVDLAAGTGPALAKIADAFQKLPDGPTKATLAVELFGKAGMDMIPMLNEGSAGLAKASEQAKKFGLVVTSDAAAAAQQLNDNLKLVKMSTKSMVNVLMQQGGEAMVRITKAMKDAAAEGGVLQAVLVGIGGVMSELAGLDMSTLKKLQVNLATAQSQREGFEGGTSDYAKENIKRLDDEIAHTKLLIEQEKHLLQMRMKRALAASQAPGADKGMESGIKSTLASANATEKATKALKDYGDARAHVDAMIAHSIKMAEMSNKAFDEALDIDQKRLQATEDIIKGVRLDAEAMEFELRTMGMSNAERARTIALLKLQASGADVAAESMQKLADRIYASVQAMEAMREQASVWNQIGDVAGRFFSDLVMNGRSAFDRLKDMLKQFLAELVAVFAKRWVLQLGASLTGNTALDAMAGSTGNGTMAGWAANAIGMSSVGAMASNFGTGFMAGFGGTSTPMVLANPGIASFGSQLGALAANPVTWIVAAAVAAVLIIRSREGGPKPGGSFFGTYDAAGGFMSTAAVPGTDNGRFFTPSDQDSAMRTLTDSFVGTFFSTLDRLGGTSGAMQFGFGTDQDPRGSAANRVMGAIYRDGMQVFQSMMEAGRDDEDLQRAFSLTMKRMLLAGLQASALPEGIARILTTVSAATGTEDEITKIIELATAFGDLMTVITEPFTAGGIIEAASKDAMTLLREQGEALLDLASNTDMTTEDLQRLTQGTAAFRQAAAQLVLTLEALKRTAIDTIDGMIEQTALSGMDPQQTFEYWQTRANDLFAQMMASSDPAEIERLLGQFTTAWNNAWSLLSPEQQAAEGGDWGRRLATARDMISTHIGALIDGVVTDTNDVLAVVGDKMDAAADKFVTAAGTQDKAAGTFAAAVDRGVKVSILVDQYGNLIVTDSGAGA
jgi:hypothetical protein